MVKIHIDRFYANNLDLTVDDIIQNIRAGITPEGVVNIHFQTRDKYYRIETNIWTGGPDFTGPAITISPYIPDVDEEKDFNAYLEHPDYFHLQLVVDETTMGDRYFSDVVIP